MPTRIAPDPVSVRRSPIPQALLAAPDAGEKLKAAVGAEGLMTIHTAKGLEFPVLVITGCEGDILPNINSAEDEAGLEEERRQRQEQEMQMNKGAAGEDSKPREPIKREGDKIGRNAPCPCGSGKKYKKCCGKLS